MEKQYHQQQLGPAALSGAHLICIVFAFVWLSQATAFASATNDWGSLTNGAQISISLEGGSNEIGTNQPVKLLIRIKNASANQTFYGYHSLAAQTDPESGLSCSVISPSGKDLSPDTKSKYFGGSGRVFSVTPGQTQDLGFNLGVLCKFSEVGTYRIIAKKAINLSATKDLFIVVSNPMNLSVVEAPVRRIDIKSVVP